MQDIRIHVLHGITSRINIGINMTDYFIIVFDLKLNKQVVKYYETKEKMLKDKKIIQKYLGRYIIVEDSTIYEDYE